MRFRGHSSSRRRGLRFTYGSFCGKRRSLLRRASSPQKVTRSLRLFGCKRPLVGADCTSFATAPSASPHPPLLARSVAPPLRKRSRARFGCSVASALTTPTRRCQPFAGNPAYTIFGKGTSRRCQPFAGNPAYTIFGKGTSRRCQPFAGIPVDTLFGKGTQIPPVCHPALRRRISNASGRFFGTSGLRMTTGERRGLRAYSENQKWRSKTAIFAQFTNPYSPAKYRCS